MSVEAARTEAESEVLAALSLAVSPSSTFDEMDISESGDSNGVLLAASVLLARLAYDRSPGSQVAELSQLLARIGADIASDGAYDDAITANRLRCIVPAEIDTAAVRSNLQTRFTSLGSSSVVPSFEQFISVAATCCTPDTRQCAGSIVQTCDDAGRWLDTKTCPAAAPNCKNGHCEALCNPGIKRCSPHRQDRI